MLPRAQKNRRLGIYFKRVELVEICLTEKTKKGTDYRGADLHLRRSKLSEILSGSRRGKGNK